MTGIGDVGIGGAGIGGVGRGGLGRGGPGKVRVEQGAGGPASGFRMPDLASPATLATGVVMAPSLLAMEESALPEQRDRAARRHGGALLAGLAALQRALLGRAEPGVLDRLATLLQHVPEPDDPRLAELQRALLVRTAVELARHRVEAAV